MKKSIYCSSSGLIFFHRRKQIIYSSGLFIFYQFSFKYFLPFLQVNTLLVCQKVTKWPGKCTVFEWKQYSRSAHVTTSTFTSVCVPAVLRMSRWKRLGLEDNGVWRRANPSRRGAGRKCECVAKVENNMTFFLTVKVSGDWDRV